MLYVIDGVPDKTIHCIPDNSQFIEVVKKSKSASLLKTCLPSKTNSTYFFFFSSNLIGLQAFI